MNNDNSFGTLYIVSTPIGNLEDISFRAIKVLSSIDFIAAEDTRKTKILLDHYKIRKQLFSYYSYNETQRTPQLIDKLKNGLSVALVTDAGTPGISDPAFRIVRSAIDENIPIVAIPGPTAFLPALTISGLSLDTFIFVGFLPVKKGRKTKLEELHSEHRTIVLYESPHRLLRTLNDIKLHFGERQIAVVRELTKSFEEVFRGKTSNAIAHFSSKTVRGEFVIIISTH
jgi:16S rRNA (cytidine1402-2'-O)-methyltransferase